MHVYGWRGRLQTILAELTRWNSGSFEGVRNARDYRIASRRMLVATLALSVYRDDHNVLPETLEQLVPKYMPRVPKDPFGTGPLVYRRLKDQRFVLYSLGQNRKDDGGTIVTAAGESIPIAARITAIADALSAMLSCRACRPAYSWEDAVSEIGQSFGTAFDPELAPVLEKALEQLHAIYLETAPDDS